MKSDKKSRSYRRYDASFKSAAVEQMRQGRSIKELNKPWRQRGIIISMAL